MADIYFIVIRKINPIASGLPAGPGSATGMVVFHPNVAKQLFNKGKDVVLVRKETSPEDIHGMFASKAILTSRGGMTSHAALVARGWGKCCIVGYYCCNVGCYRNSFDTKALIGRCCNCVALVVAQIYEKLHCCML